MSIETNVATRRVLFRHHNRDDRGPWLTHQDAWQAAYQWSSLLDGESVGVEGRDGTVTWVATGPWVNPEHVTVRKHF